jgi:hypothetical protein
VSEQTLEAPRVEVPAEPGFAPPPAAPSLRELVYRWRWVLSAGALLVISAIIVLDARTRPGYDPYGWLVWGKLTLHLKLDTNGAPSWKPLPFLFTVPYAVAGHYALWLWMITSVAISLSGLIFAWRIAFKLTGADPARRYAAYAAGLFAAVLVLALQDPLGYTYTHYLLSAESDTMIVAICLAAIDCHLSGRHRWAFWLWWLGSLGRPEVWPFWVLAGAWLWRSVPGHRRWVIGSVVLLLVLWFGIPGLTSKSFLTAGNIAENSPRAIHGNKVTGTIHRFFQLEPAAVWVSAAVTLVLAAWRRQRAILLLTGGALVWVVIEIAFALHGFPAVPRYMFEPGAVVAVLGGVFAGRVVLELPGIVARAVRRLDISRIRGPAMGRIGAWAAALVLLVFAASMVPTARGQLRLERADLRHEHARTKLFNELTAVVRRIGPARILACGQPNIPIEYQSVLAWNLDLKIGELYVDQKLIARYPRPLVNMYPIRGGWKVFTSHVNPGAQAARCQGLRFVAFRF